MTAIQCFFRSPPKHYIWEIPVLSAKNKESEDIMTHHRPTEAEPFVEKNKSVNSMELHMSKAFHLGLSKRLRDELLVALFHKKHLKWGALLLTADFLIQYQIDYGAL